MKFLRMIMVMITVSGAAFSQEKDKEAKLEELKKILDELHGPQIKISNRRFAALDSVNRAEIPHLKDFLTLYPQSYVRYLSFAGTEFPGLSVNTTLHNRYTLNMRLPVMYSEDHRSVIGYGVPRFHLIEVIDIILKDGRLSQSGGGDLQKHFDVEAWKKVLVAQGDFSVLGYELKKNSPVPNFDFVIKSIQELERKIPAPVKPGKKEPDQRRPSKDGRETELMPK